MFREANKYLIYLKGGVWDKCRIARLVNVKTQWWVEEDGNVPGFCWQAQMFILCTLQMRILDKILFVLKNISLVLEKTQTHK